MYSFINLKYVQFKDILKCALPLQLVLHNAEK